jgi:hypothetical protein
MPHTNQIKGLQPSRRTPGATYHWKPSPRLRRLGWTNLRLGEDWDTPLPPRSRTTGRRAMARRQRRRRRSEQAAEDPPLARSRRRLQGERRLGRLKPKSKREYDSRLRILDHWALDGALRLCDLDRPMIIDFRNTLARDPRKPRTAAILRVLSIVVGHGVNRGWLPLGLAARMNIPTPAKRRHRILAEQLPWLLDAADALGLAHVRLGCVLGFFTMQREGDLLATTAFRFREVDDISGEARRALAGPTARARPVPRAGENRRAGRHSARAPRPRGGRGGDRCQPRRRQHVDASCSSRTAAPAIRKPSSATSPASAIAP